MPRPITPPKVTGRVKDFCDRLSPGQTPIHLPITPAKGAKLSDCFPTVLRHVEAHGGEMVVGWQVWLQPGVLIEAEYHGVWKDSAGKLHDITPKPSGFSQILFVADPTKPYNGRQLDNIREALSDAPEVAALITAFKELNAFKNQPRFIDVYGNLAEHFTQADRAAFSAIDQRLRAAQAAYTIRFDADEVASFKGKINRNMQCFCGSGRKYKQCHGG